jgi:hypothetical protein
MEVHPAESFWPFYWQLTVFQFLTWLWPTGIKVFWYTLKWVALRVAAIHVKISHCFDKHVLIAVGWNFPLLQKGMKIRFAPRVVSTVSLTMLAINVVNRRLQGCLQDMIFKKDQPCWRAIDLRAYVIMCMVQNKIVPTNCSDRFVLERFCFVGLRSLNWRQEVAARWSEPMSRNELACPNTEWKQRLQRIKSIRRRTPMLLSKV